MLDTDCEGAAKQELFLVAMAGAQVSKCMVGAYKEFRDPICEGL